MNQTTALRQKLDLSKIPGQDFESAIALRGHLGQSNPSPTVRALIQGARAKTNAQQRQGGRRIIQFELQEYLQPTEEFDCYLPLEFIPLDVDPLFCPNFEVRTQPQRLL